VSSLSLVNASQLIDYAAGSIRAYGAEETFKAEALRRIDIYTRAARPYYNLNRWISIRVNALGGAFSAALAAYLVYGQNSDAPTTGFSLSLVRQPLWACHISLIHFVDRGVLADRELIR